MNDAPSSHAFVYTIVNHTLLYMRLFAIVLFNIQVDLVGSNVEVGVLAELCTSRQTCKLDEKAICSSLSKA